MSNIVRTWKDKAYRWNFPVEEQDTLSSNLPGKIELTDAELASVYGGSTDARSYYVTGNNNILGNNNNINPSTSTAGTTNPALKGIGDFIDYTTGENSPIDLLTDPLTDS